MTESLQSYIGIVAGVLIFLSYFSYTFSTIRGTTKPNRATWFTLAVISSVLAVSYFDLGARSTFWAAGGAALGTILIALLSIKYGTGGWSLLEKMCMGFSLLSLIFYILSDNALVTLLLGIGMDGAALVPTVMHAYAKPHEEDKAAWTLTFTADILAVLAIDQRTFSIIIYPLYMVLVNGMIAALLYRRQLALGKEVSKTILDQSS